MGEGLVRFVEDLGFVGARHDLPRGVHAGLVAEGSTECLPAACLLLSAGKPLSERIAQQFEPSLLSVVLSMPLHRVLISNTLCFYYNYYDLLNRDS